MDLSPASATPASPRPGVSWSQVVKKIDEPISSRVAGPLPSKGISVAVIDGSAFIHGDKLAGVAETFVTVKEVLAEVRDLVSRQRLAVFPFHVETKEPSVDSIKKVQSFASKTGDLRALSDVDIKVIALAYTLEAQIHGTATLRENPPPLCKVNGKSLPQTEMPGWGSNVPNLAEWEALENDALEGKDAIHTRILPLKVNSSNIISEGETTSLLEHDGSKRHTVYGCPKEEIMIEGKKMVAHGIDASKGEYGDNPGDWRPAVCRSTHRSYLRRKAVHGASEKLNLVEQEEEASKKQSMADQEESIHASISENGGVLSNGVSQCVIVTPESHGEEIANAKDGQARSCDAGNTDTKHMVLETRFEPLAVEPGHVNCMHIEGTADDVVDAICKEDWDDVEQCALRLNNLDISSQTDECVDNSDVDDISSENKCGLPSFSESRVACITGDFAMQNVILQIGLRLLAPGGMQLRHLQRWIFKCHACNTVTAESHKIFCPNCGNGGTLLKLPVTGNVLTDRRRRINLRGTKFSIPLPQGGREGITKNFVLREDQIPRKLLYPKTKKKINIEDAFTVDDFFTEAGRKKAPLKPPVGRTVLFFTGKRNPNDNHFSRRKC